MSSAKGAAGGGGKASYAAAASSSKGADSRFEGKEKEKDVRASNIAAAKAIADAIRTSLGPRGMDKMICSPNGEVTVTNDGATILSKLEVQHPAARMFVDLSKSQDVEAGDGTTSVVVVAGALLGAAQRLIEKGIHPATISDAFLLAERRAQDVLRTVSVPLDLGDRESLLRAATTSLNSKVVSQYSDVLAPIAVDAVLAVIDPATATNVELRDVRVVKKLGDIVENTELVNGLVFTQRASHVHGAPTRVANAKILLIQYCLSPPKTNMESNVVISSWNQMDRVIVDKERYISKLVLQIKRTGANVLLVQKSILRDALTNASLELLAKKGIMVVKDIERSDIEFICKNIGCQPVASPEGLSKEKLGTAALVEEERLPAGSIVRITGVPNPGRTVSVLVRGSNRLVLDEAERSLHDALCVIRSLVKLKFLTPGGGAPEAEMSLRLGEYAKTLSGVASYCVREYAQALETVPYTLAENAGLNAIEIVTLLRQRHAAGEKTAGINVRKGTISDILQQRIVQPMLVNSSALTLATETVTMLLRVDDLIIVR